MKNGSPNRRPVIVAGVAASFLMLVFGIGYRVPAARLAKPLGKIKRGEAFRRFRPVSQMLS
jgi:cytochrome c biogenesis protein CcdA